MPRQSVCHILNPGCWIRSREKGDDRYSGVSCREESIRLRSLTFILQAQYRRAISFPSLGPICLSVSKFAFILRRPNPESLLSTLSIQQDNVLLGDPVRFQPFHKVRSPQSSILHIPWASRDRHCIYWVQQYSAEYENDSVASYLSSLAEGAMETNKLSKDLQSGKGYQSSSQIGVSCLSQEREECQNHLSRTARVGHRRVNPLPGKCRRGKISKWIKDQKQRMLRCGGGKCFKSEVDGEFWSQGGGALGIK